jgi:hypothetical protein
MTASADTPLANVNQPAAPNTGATLLLRFRFDNSFSSA